MIFDEVHYMQDRERGVVWEEAIIFLPKGIRMVFLSATLSNASEFAGWVCHLHQQPCHVVYTDFRPTPLQHYAFPTGGSGLYLVGLLAGAALHVSGCLLCLVAVSYTCAPTKSLLCWHCVVLGLASDDILQGNSLVAVQG